MVELRLVKTGRRAAKEMGVCSSRMVYDVQKKMAKFDREHLVALHLDGRNRIIARETVSIGCLTSSIVHPREVFKAAIAHGSAALILVHNHPSGDPMPSREDREITARLMKTADIVGIAILDHIVIGDGKYVSMAEEEKNREK